MVGQKSYSISFVKGFKRRWPGYLLIISLAVFSYMIGHLVSGRDRFFVERDPDLSYPFRDDTSM